ncbi:MAG: imidazoleglycerol-phosphate dehydratase HisB [Eubacteriales bacterium]|nr:imidazoleglycerol-phosphate dehydratase HisB [Eubacteriales bacterium]
MRQASIERTTAETEIALQLTLEGSGHCEVETDCGFLKHMLELFAHHGRFDLVMRCRGDSEVDYHHTVEDVGIVLGTAFRQALGDCRGIARYGDQLLPMDEALILVALDISGRVSVNLDYEVQPTVGTFDTELVAEFLKGFARHLGLTLHVRQLAGENTHHILEGIFKALGRAMAKAVTIEEGREKEIPSSKGVL